MDRQDMNRTAKTIRSLVKGKRYSEAIAIADKLNLDKINNGILILDIVEAYEKLGDKKSAKNTLLAYYDMYGITGRNMMQKLVELCIETRDIENAVGLCMQFENEWPNSSISYLMRYQITASAGGSFSEQIHYLEKYREAELDERWGYELAKLYHRNNQREKCADICHDIICYFGHGVYVDKAVHLKQRVGGVTPDEKEILKIAAQREENARRMREEELLRIQEEERLQEEKEKLREEESLLRGKEELQEAERFLRGKEKLQEEERLLREKEKLQEEERFLRGKERLQEEERFLRGKERLQEEGLLKEKQRLQEEQSLREKQNRSWNSYDMMAYERVDDPFQFVINRDGKENVVFDGSDSDRPDSDSEIVGSEQLIKDAEANKILQTENAAKQRRQKQIEEQMARQEKIASALRTEDHYLEVENRKADSIYFSDFPRQVIPGKKTEKERREKGVLSRIAAGFRKSVKTENPYSNVLSGIIGQGEAAAEEEIMIPTGNMEIYMQKELELLNEEQVENLTAEQVKEIYELKILRTLRMSVKALVEEDGKIYGVKMDSEKLTRFAEQDPFVTIVPVQEEEKVSVKADDETASSETGHADYAKYASEQVTLNQGTSPEKSNLRPDIWKKEESRAEKKKTDGKTFITDTSPKEVRHVVSGGKIQVFDAGKETLSKNEKEAAAFSNPEKKTAAVLSNPEEKAAAVETVNQPDKSDAPEAGIESAKKQSAGGINKTGSRLYEFIKGKMNLAESQEENAESKESAAKPLAGQSEKDAEQTDVVFENSSTMEQDSDAEAVEKEKYLSQLDDTGKAVNEVLKETLEKQMQMEDSGESVSNEKEHFSDTSGSSPKDDSKVTANAPEKITPFQALSEENYLQYVIRYAEKKGFYVDEGAYMTIRVLEDEMRKKGIVLTVDNAVLMTDQAIKRLQKRNPLDRFMDKYNKKNAITLRDKHFDWK